MITSTIFMPQYYAEDFEIDGATALLSITDPRIKLPVFSAPFLAIERIAFQDFTIDDGIGVPPRKEHAIAIIEYAAKIHSLMESVAFAIHCRSGRSRSAAVAQ